MILPVMRKFIRRVLTISGLDIGACVDAEDGRQALDILRTNWMDIVLTDIKMPVMNGEDLLQSLAGDPVLRSIPVVVISTDHSPSRLSRMLSLGARDYLTRPFLPETLRDTLERQLSGDSHAINIV